MRPDPLPAIAPGGDEPDASGGVDVLRALLAGPGVRPVFVFAHADDAVLSATGALRAAGGSGLDVLVCAGRPPSSGPSLWDRLAGFTTSWEAHRVRMEEHDRACAALGLASLRLDVLDGQYRPGDAEALVGAGEAGEAGGPLVDVAADRIGDLAPGAVVSHRHDAWHPDHRAAAHLGGALARRLGVPVVRVCDRPYVHCGPACGGGAEPGGDRSWARRTVRLDDGRWRAKCALVDLYGSQQRLLQAMFGTSWGDRARLGWECYALDR